jgi:hypothetical protein
MKSIILGLLASVCLTSIAYADDICADRPTKSTGTCTVDQGHFQLETDLFNVTTQKQDGVTTTTTLFTNPTLKYGISKNADVEINLTPYEEVNTGGSKLYGVGDLYVRSKVALVNNPTWQLSIEPYVKAPTARLGIGNGRWEGGVVAPIGITLNNTFSLSLDPEIDVLKNNRDDGYHLNTSQVLSLAMALPHKVTAYSEVWANYDYEPTGMVSQYSFDIGTSWIASKNVEIDGGINFGLNKNTPRTQFYLGFGKHF